MEPTIVSRNKVRVIRAGEVDLTPTTPEEDTTPSLGINLPASRIKLPRRWVQLIDCGESRYSGEIVWETEWLVQVQIGPTQELVFSKAKVKIHDAVPPKGRDVLMGRAGASRVKEYAENG